MREEGRDGGLGEEEGKSKEEGEGGVEGRVWQEKRKG